MVDASVLTNALTDDGSVGASSRAELARDAHWAAPAHIVVEVFSAIRGRWLGHKISQTRAEDALSAMVSITIDPRGQGSHGTKRYLIWLDDGAMTFPEKGPAVGGATVHFPQPEPRGPRGVLVDSSTSPSSRPHTVSHGATGPS